MTSRAFAYQPRRSLMARGGTKAPDSLRITLIALTIVSLSQVHQHFGPVAALRPALVLFLAATGMVLLNPRRLDLKNVWSTWQGLTVVALGALAALSVIFGISTGRAGMYMLTDFSKTLLFGLLLIGTMRSTGDVLSIVRAYVIGSAVLVWMALFVFAPIYSGGTMRLNNLYSYDANDIGLILTLAIPLTLVVFNTSGRVGKLLSILLLVGIMQTMARTGSRGAIIGLVVVGVALLAVSSHVSLFKRLAVALGLIGALAVAAPDGYWERMETLLNPTQDYNWTAKDGRKEVAKRGMGYMLEYPLFGIGINNFPMAEGLLSAKAREHVPGTGLRWTAAHNTYVQIGSEMGVTGLALWLFLLLGSIVAMLRIRRKLPAQWARGSKQERSLYFLALYLPVAILGFLATSAFVSFAYLDPPYILAACVAGVSVCVRQAHKPVSSVRPGRSWRKRTASRALAMDPLSHRDRPAPLAP